MKNFVLIAVVSVILSACIFSKGNKPQEVWSRKGKTAQQTSQQIKFCKQKVNSQPMANKKRPSMFRKCMSDKGYRYGAPQ